MALGGWFGHRAGLGGWSILQRSIDSDGIRRLLEVSGAVWLLILIALSLNDVLPLHRNRRPVASDVAGIAALAVLVVLIRRGSISTGSLNRVVDPTAGGSTDPRGDRPRSSGRARLVPLTLRAASTASPRRWPLTKLTLAEATAQPLRAIATASLIAVTVMFALLSFGYASTLQLGSRDQAAFAVPYDFRLQLGPALVRPQQLAPEAVGPRWPREPSPPTCCDVALPYGSRQPIRKRSSCWASIRRPWTSCTAGDRISGNDRASSSPRSTQPAPPPLGTTLPGRRHVDRVRRHRLRGPAHVGGHRPNRRHVARDHSRRRVRRRRSHQPDTGRCRGELIGFRLAQPADVSARVEHHIGEGTTSEAARAIDVVLSHVQTTTPTDGPPSVDLQVDRLRAADAVVEVQPDSAVRVTGSLLGVAIS